MKESRSETLALRGLRHHVRTWGDAAAPKLFLLHGWMDVGASFQFLVDAFARDWHVIAPDLRGFGLTEWAPGGYWFPDYYADLDALAEHYQPAAPLRLIGHSMGGVIASMYAGIRPERVARLVSMEGIGLARHPAEDAPLRYAEWIRALAAPPDFKPYRSFADVAVRLRKNNPRLPQDKADFLARHWAKPLGNGEVVLRSDPRHKMVNPYLFRVDEAIACWRRVTAPVLLVWGRQSEIPARIKDSPEQLAERTGAFRDCRQATLDDCGHMMHHDQPERLGRLIEDFVAG